MNPPGPSGRKRAISESEEPGDLRSKRSRIQPPVLSSPLPPTPTRSPTITRTFDYDRGTMPLRGSDGERYDIPRSRPLSTSSSISIPGTPGPPAMLIRSASFSSFHSQMGEASLQPYYPDGSSKYCLRDSRFTVDFSPSSEKSMPLAYFPQNHNLYFSRGNRVHYRNMIAADSVSQLCKLQDKDGDLTLLEAGGTHLALATSNGIVQVWDTQSKKLICNWTTKGVGSMAWNESVLSIGGTKGTIRHYDIRVQPTSKMKEQASKVTRHQASIATLTWNKDGKLLASGDESGLIYTWDSRARIPLDVGEFHQRRKKIQHAHPISALAWSPWQSKLLATGDVGGTVKLWTIDQANPKTNATSPSQLEHGSKIVNLDFSPNYRELLTVLGPIVVPAIPSTTPDLSPWPRIILTNSITVHSFPSLRHIATVPVSERDVCGSILNTGTSVHKIVVAIPSETKLKVFEVWGKKKEIRRQTSSLGTSIR